MLIPQSRERSGCDRDGAGSWSWSGLISAAAVLLLVLGVPSHADAYVGPGAGFAVMSSALVAVVTALVAIGSLLVWPFRALWRLCTGRHPPKTSIDRVIIVGFDGQDPVLTDRFLSEGVLPHFQRLADSGAYQRLGTTLPPISPVAWSSFSTGSHPPKHGIYDFIDRDRRTYLPLLSSTRIGKVTRSFKIGRYRIPLEKPELTLLRKSKPFWKILGEHRVWSTVLRVPITFPPDSFYGAQLSAMCVPDLQGTQGSFQLFTTRLPDRRTEGGTTVPIVINGDRVTTTIEGPPNTLLAGDPPIRIPFVMELDRKAGMVHANAGGTAFRLELGQLTPWQTLKFRAAPGFVVTGIARFQLREMGDHLSVYLSPININPERPAMPISHPWFYSNYLAQRIGPYATLGLAEDTWALNEDAIDERTFLAQTYDIDEERRKMFFAALDRLRKGALVCVFDATDRIQHMFWRYLDPEHPANRSKAVGPHAEAVLDLYKKNDELVGQILTRLSDRDVLMVISDHGFNSFRRGVNLNAWLHREGYLSLMDGQDGSVEWHRGVDWSRTRAFALGLAGIRLNIRSRERQGIVDPLGEVAALKAELVAKLTGLIDPETGHVAIRRAFDPAQVGQGPYHDQAPDILIGYNAGYRVSWDGATGIAAGPIFTDNVKAWSGDHCIDPGLVPGVFFCNRRVDDEELALVDIAPTVLQLFGIAPPAYMDGKAFGLAQT